MKIKFMFVIFLFLFSTPVFANDGYEKVGSSVLYYQYYPSTNAKFKGTILFQNGSGTDLTEWTKNKIFFSCIRRYGNILLYDRNGIGKSPADLKLSTNHPMTAKFINKKFSLLLKKLHINPPYILVAHSYGAMYAGYFARKYPKLVKAILLVDPVPPDYQWASNFLSLQNTTKAQMQKMKSMTSKQLYIQYSFDRANKTNTMSAQLFYQLIGFDKTKSQIKALPAINKKIPVIIISSTYMEKNAPIEGDWLTLQKHWLTKNIKSKIIQVRSGHFIQLEHPRLVCKELEKLVAF